MVVMLLEGSSVAKTWEEKLKMRASDKKMQNNFFVAIPPFITYITDVNLYLAVYVLHWTHHFLYCREFKDLNLTIQLILYKNNRLYGKFYKSIEK